ncbi:MAG TPA: hypothetical protein VFG04_30930 [Planctomycetaceae bacterium]|jgi:hypothetical protein|nr:hypothetical protein [Planctomycetaceae bacterium]
MSSEVPTIPHHIIELCSACVSKEAPTGDAKAPFGGVNWRVDASKAANAVFQLTTWFVKSVATLTVAPGPIQFIEVTVKGWRAVLSTLEAIREEMKPLPYCAYVVLSSSPQGLTHAELQQRLSNYVNEMISSKWPLPWIGLSKDELTTACKALSYSGQLDDLIRALIKSDYAEEKDGHVFYRSKNFSLGFTQRS